jgi:hypothetical protein
MSRRDPLTGRHRKPRDTRRTILDYLAGVRVAAEVAGFAALIFLAATGVKAQAAETSPGAPAAMFGPAVAAVQHVTACGRERHAGTYELTGCPRLGHGAETVTVRLRGSVHHVYVYVEPASGDYQTFALARYDTQTHRWVAVLTFSTDDEAGTWYVVSAIGETRHGFEQRTEPNPAFTVQP